MPVYITLKNNKLLSWTLKPSSPVQPADYPNVEAIAVSGAELGYIVGRFKNIPLTTVMNPQQVVWWFGDWAKFIVANL